MTLIELVRAYFNAEDALNRDLNGTQFSPERLDWYRDKLRELIQTDKDRVLVAEARSSHSYSDCIRLQSECDTTSAWYEIEDRVHELYRREEYDGE